MIFYINYHTTIIADTLHNGEMSMYNFNTYRHIHVVRCSQMCNIMCRKGEANLRDIHNHVVPNWAPKWKEPAKR